VARGRGRRKRNGAASGSSFFFGLARSSLTASLARGGQAKGSEPVYCVTARSARRRVAVQGVLFPIGGWFCPAVTSTDVIFGHGAGA